MAHCVVLTNTTHFFVDSWVNYNYVLLLKFLINVSEICIIVHDIMVD